MKPAMHPHRPPSHQAPSLALCRLPYLPHSLPLCLPLCLALLLAHAPAWSHGGEDHGDTPAASAPAQQAPRASAQTDSFELVAVLDQGDAQHPPTLTLYLDQADTNEPVAQASIDVESGAFKASAQPVGPGVYTVPGSAFAQPGRYPLTFSVQSADTADLLDATLVTGAHDGHGAPTTGAATTTTPRWPWLAAGAALLIALGTAAARWARRRAQNSAANSAPDSTHNRTHRSSPTGPV